MMIAAAFNQIIIHHDMKTASLDIFASCPALCKLKIKRYTCTLRVPQTRAAFVVGSHYPTRLVSFTIIILLTVELTAKGTL